MLSNRLYNSYQLNSKSIESLQVVRAIAAILVLLSHVNDLINTRLGHFYGSNLYASNLFSSGYAGVDIFFVLSGFIIYYTNQEKISTLTKQEFILRRIIRIFPIYWIALICSIGILLLGKYVFPASANNFVLIKLIESGDINLFVSSIFLFPSKHSLVRVSWTLSYEIMFYITFGILFFYKKKLFIILMILWTILSFTNYLIASTTNITFGFMADTLLNPIISEFLFGCIIAIIVLKYPPKYPIVMLTTGVIFFILSASIVDTSPLRIFFFGIPSALIIYGMIYIRFDFHRILILFGDASYSIYLFHIQLIYLMLEVMKLFKLYNFISNEVAFILISLSILLICCCIYIYVEKPILDYLRRNLINFTSKVPEICQEE